MQGQVGAAEVRIVVQMVDAVGIEEARPEHQAVHLVVLRQQQLREAGPVLAGHPDD
jgi:hypothetical protein